MRALTADGTELAAIERPSPELDQGVGAALTGCPHIVVRRWRQQRIERRLQRRAALEIEDAIQPDHAVARLTDVEIASLVGMIGLR
ncbi:MAG TPA: hypothetical protein VJT14_04760, partial [Candidatus Dormibacteraeota bacterium]|nr:hypothetical protein [Candidatus Dormibacteraeota bacterium]